MKLCAMWINYERSKAQEDEDIMRRGDMLMYMAIMLNQKLEGEKKSHNHQAINKVVRLNLIRVHGG